MECAEGAARSCGTVCDIFKCQRPSRLLAACSGSSLPSHTGCASKKFHRAGLVREFRQVTQRCICLHPFDRQQAYLGKVQMGRRCRRAVTQVQANEKVGQKFHAADSSLELESRASVADDEAASEKTFQRGVVSAILQAGVIACVKRENQNEALRAARAGLDGGLTVLEVTMTVPGALEVVRTLVNDYPDATIGVGTIYSLEEAKEAANAGACFVMSPILNEEIAHAQTSLHVTYIPGAMTPTEIWEAHRRGCQLVKVFPANEALLKALQRPLSRLTDPPLSLVASHGVQEGDIQRYLGQKLAGVVVLSDTIFGHGSGYEEIKAAAQRVVALAQSQIAEAE